MRLFRLENPIESNKATCCNYESEYLWALADNETEAKQLLKDNLAGICAYCMCELLQEEGYEIKKSNQEMNSEILDNVLSKIEYKDGVKGGSQE